MRNSPILVETRYSTTFLMVAYIDLPSSIAATILLKLLSRSIKSAASLATSVPPWPIAIPKCAAFKERASFTPSPVIPIMSPLSLYASTMANLFSGNTLPKTETPESLEPSSSLLRVAISLPDRTVSPCFKI